MKKAIPIYSITDFEQFSGREDYYANYLDNHVREHHFTLLPHKHNFYLVMLVTAGSGWHEIDFIKYPVKPGSMFIMQPGQMHYWKFSKKIKGFVFFHSRAFYDQAFASSQLRRFPFYRSFQSIPAISLNRSAAKKITAKMEEIVLEYKSAAPMHKERLHALFNLVYIDLARHYVQRGDSINPLYLSRLTEFEKLLEEKFMEHRQPSFYANELNISEKHLNRIIKECLGKTSTQLISERVVLEAKRVLMQPGTTVTGTGDALCFSDKSYFIRFFKKNTGITPYTFFKNYHRA